VFHSYGTVRAVGGAWSATRSAVRATGETSLSDCPAFPSFWTDQDMNEQRLLHLQPL
jgi:hypothetical protein